MKEFLYIGYYFDILGRFILKIGTTCDLDRRRKEHTNNYKKAAHCPMPADGTFEYLWHLPLSKWNTHRFEEINISIPMVMPNGHMMTINVRGFEKMNLDEINKKIKIHGEVLTPAWTFSCFIEDVI